MSHPVQHATQQWIERVVLGYNFCPFAHRVVEQQQVHYEIIDGDDLEAALVELIIACRQLDAQPNIETTLLIFSEGFVEFEDYLDGLAVAETLLFDMGYEGVYQLASFHPDYCFAGEDPEAATHYTNRSPYPMWHLLREASLEQAIAQHPDTASIPERNATVAAEQSPEAWAAILKQCYDISGN